MQALLVLSISLMAGLMLSRVAKLFNLPAVTAYLVAGIIVGPFVLGQIGVPGIGFISKEDVESYSIICDVALGFIAFSIGNEFRISQLKKVGRQATIIGIFQAVITTLLVDAALIGLHFILGEEVLPLSAAIVLGAIAAATAPAATLMVVKQYKAKGPLTDILLPIVALDDAVGLVLFAVSFGVAKSIATTSGAINVAAIILEPIIEVSFSLLLGFVMGILFNFFERFFHSRSKRLAMSICFVLLTVALSKLGDMYELSIAGFHVAFSPLLTCMMLGTVFCNTCDFSEELMGRVDRWSGPILILFFVLSGAELKLSVLTSVSVLIIGAVYIISRSLGKYFGAYSSALISKCDSNIVKYLGVTLLPQAGVALGMSKIATRFFEGTNDNVALIIGNITLFAVLVYELIGPLLTKIALTKAGDIKPEGKRSVRDDVRAAMAEGKDVRHHH